MNQFQNVGYLEKKGNELAPLSNLYDLGKYRYGHNKAKFMDVLIMCSFSEKMPKYYY